MEHLDLRDLQEPPDLLGLVEHLDLVDLLGLRVLQEAPDLAELLDLADLLELLEPREFITERSQPL